MNELIRGEHIPSLANKVLLHYDKLYCDPQSIKNGDIVYCDTHNILKFKEILINKRNLKIITHNSDYYVCDEKPHNKNGVDLSLFKGCFDFWLAQNSYSKNKNVVPIPIGFENKRWEARFGPKTHWLQEVSKDQLSALELVYLNCKTKTNPKERGECYAYCDGLSFVNCEPPNLSYKNFLQKVKSHKFTISPEGNGLDCHRTWEILMMGRIPIIKRKATLERLYGEELPVLFIDKWEDLNTLNLEKIYISLQEKVNKAAGGYLYFSYWRNKFNKLLYT